MVFLILFFSCSDRKNRGIGYKNIKGIMVEQPLVFQNKDSLFFNADNHIYKVGKIFSYSTKRTTHQGLGVGERLNSLGFTIEVLQATTTTNKSQNIYQTSLEYRITDSKQVSVSGVVENEKNVWIHPPRNGYFKILELNPFPYVKTPLKIGNSWKWSLKIGEQWSDERWLGWSGEIENK